jgi:hypothetical protein
VAVLLADDARMTVLVPNTDEAARRLLPGAGDSVRLAWLAEHMHLVRDAEAGETALDPAKEPKEEVFT